MIPTFAWPYPDPGLGVAYRRDFDIGGGVPDPVWEDIQRQRKARTEKYAIERAVMRDKRIGELETQLASLKAEEEKTPVSLPAPNVRKMRLD